MSIIKLMLPLKSNGIVHAKFSCLLKCTYIVSVPVVAVVRLNALSKDTGLYAVHKMPRIKLWHSVNIVSTIGPESPCNFAQNK